jgi:hypothetical protein
MEVVDFTRLNTNSFPIINIEGRPLLPLASTAPRLMDQAYCPTLKSHFEPRVSCNFLDTRKQRPPVPVHHNAIDAHKLASPAVTPSIPTDSIFPVYIGNGPIRLRSNQPETLQHSRVERVPDPALSQMFHRKFERAKPTSDHVAILVECLQFLHLT